ncbi:MAG: DUF87 domain-containing protein [Planctomycetota bacterium]|nr:DUF87 domain-containing protein [Planctomycetota bacterium]
MEIKTLLDKLEPLIPEVVKQWRRSLYFVNEKTALLIEKSIITTAYDLLGDFDKKLLLSLPPEKKAKGQFHLGTVIYEKDKWPFGLSKAQLLRHTVILGISGSGKTNIALALLKQLVDKKVSFLILDWRQNYRHVLPMLNKTVHVYTPGKKINPFPFNPLIPPPGVEHHIYINHLVDVMASAFTLGEGARSILQQVISVAYKEPRWPTFHDVLRMLEEQEVKNRAHGWKMSAVRALRSLCFSDLAGSKASSQRELVSSLLRGNTIVELDGVHQDARKFLIPMLCVWLYQVQLAGKQREQLDLMLFIEEAGHVLYKQENRSKESVMNLFLRQCRELGIGVVVIDQHPHLLSSAAIGNTYTTIILNQKDPSDVNKAASILLLDEKQKKWLSMLPVGQAIVKLQDKWFRPVLLKIPHVPVNKGAVTNRLLEALSNGRLTLSGLKRAVGNGSGEKGQFRLADMTLDESAVAFLEDVIAHEDDGVFARYKRLGVSADKGNRLKKRLIEQGILQEQQVSIGRTRKMLLRPTTVAKRELGLDTIEPDRGSIVHEFWKRVYADKFRRLGYHVDLEAPRINGRVDVLATKASETVAIEVETGKSDIVWNVKQNILSKFCKVLVVATDEQALEKVEKELAKARLLIPSRVKIVLRDEMKEVVGTYSGKDRARLVGA